MGIEVRMVSLLRNSTQPDDHGHSMPDSCAGDVPEPKADFSSVPAADEQARHTAARRWLLTYGLVTVSLVALNVTIHRLGWKTDHAFHTLIEVLATTLAFFAGACAFVRYYSRPENTYLFVATGFVGAGLLDGYHAVVTAIWFRDLMPSAVEHMIPWSWVASRLFLSMFLVLAWRAWQREQRMGDAGRVSSRMIYLAAALLTIMSFCLFAFVPLPRAVFPVLFFHRPEELVPAVLFLTALCGFASRGNWREDRFECWLMLSILVNLLSQSLFMARSSAVFDGMFDVAHLLKNVSYGLVIIGLLFDTFSGFRKADAFQRELLDRDSSDRTLRRAQKQMAERMMQIVEGQPNGIVMVDQDGTIAMVNRQLEASFGYPRRELLGVKIQTLIPEEHWMAHPGHIDTFSRSTQRVTSDIRPSCGRRKDGSLFPVELGLSPIQTDEGTFILGSVVDITERRATEDERIRVQQEAAELAKRDAWLAAGHREISDLVVGEHSMGDLARSAIRLLSQRLDCQIGLLYVADSEDDTLRLTASYAHSIRKHLASTFRPGEGIVGQVAVEKERFVLTDVPDDYIRIESGLGSIPPRNLLIQPLLFGEQVNGVIELGSVRPLNELQLELIDRVSEILAVAIHSAQSRERSRQLLSQTLEQADRLKSQQEELRATNQELEQQARQQRRTEDELRVRSEELERRNGELRDQTAQLQASEEQLKSQRRELQDSNHKLEQRQMELEASQRELESKRNELERQTQELASASRYKSEFLANMSHELRTPLNSMLILSQLLADNAENTLTEQQMESARVIFDSSTDLLGLINDILDLSKVEAGRMNLHLEPVSPHGIVSNMHRQFQPVADRSGVAFTCSVMDDVPGQIVADVQRIGQVLKNFLSNAFKFTDAGSVTLCVDMPQSDISFYDQSLSTASLIAFRVEDTGAGIAPEQLSLIFEAFQQADGSTSRTFGGTGLGLTISRELAELMGGEVHVISQPGEGSTFTLYLPTTGPTSGEFCEGAVDDAVPAVADAADSDVIPEQVNGGESADRPEIFATPNCGSGGMEVPADVIPSTEDSIFVLDDRRQIGHNDRVILIVEDNEAFARTLMGIARERGYKCLVSGTGRQGLLLAMQHQPHCILLDIGLPDLNGDEVLEHLKSDLSTRHIPVHVITGRDPGMTVMQRGAVGVLTKPASVDALTDIFAGIEALWDRQLSHVLVVEDDRSSPQSIVNLIEYDSTETITASSGASALQQLRTAQFDCMVLDMELSDMSGFDLVQKMSADCAELPPAVVYTGRDLTPGEQAQLRQYAERVVVKEAVSHDRLVDEVCLFLHSVDDQLSEEQRRMLTALHGTNDQLQGCQVLLVDDDVRNTFSLSQVLAQHGLEVTIADNGELALEKLEANPGFAIVLLDIMMPVMDGYETLMRIRQDPRFEDLPVIAQTALAMPEDRARCLEAGASDYITKPIDTDHLLNLMKVWLVGTAPAESAAVTATT